jgi:hypothetical protein
VQDLRRRAAEAGNLSSTTQQRVSRSGSYWIIEPVEPEYVYVPAYEPAVYGMWPYSDYPPYNWYAVRRDPGRIIWFATAAVIGTALWARWDWNRRQVAIDPIRFNRFNRANRAITTWQHDPLRRRGAPYKAPVLVNKFKDIKPSPTLRDIRGRQPPPALLPPAVKRGPGAGSAPPLLQSPAITPGTGSAARSRSRNTTPKATQTPNESINRTPRTIAPPRAVVPRSQAPNAVRRAPPPVVSRSRPEVRRAPPVSKPAISRPSASRPPPAATRAAPPPRAPAPAAAPRAGRPAAKSKAANP